jgi:hypothetical protein
VGTLHCLLRNGGHSHRRTKDKIPRNGKLFHTVMVLLYLPHFLVEICKIMYAAARSLRLTKGVADHLTPTFLGMPGTSDALL